MAIENRKVIGRRELIADPHAVWNAFVSLIASDYSDLDQAQRPAHLVFWYESEAQNGGHLQYFLNRGTDHTRETIEALRTFNADEHVEMLEKAIALWMSKERDQPSSVDEYVDVASEGEFEDLDSAFYSARTELTAILERQLVDNEELFIIRS